MKKVIIFTFVIFRIFISIAQVDDKKVEQDIHHEVFNLGLEDLINMEITVATKKAVRA